MLTIKLYSTVIYLSHHSSFHGFWAGSQVGSKIESKATNNRHCASLQVCFWFVKNNRKMYWNSSFQKTLWLWHKNQFYFAFYQQFLIYNNRTVLKSVFIKIKALCSVPDDCQMTARTFFFLFHFVQVQTVICPSADRIPSFFSFLTNKVSEYE